MGEMNFIKGAFTGKVGSMVGSKWKVKNTVRSYSKPANPRTIGQQEVRGGFKNLTEVFATFAPQLAGINALNTKAQSARNALISLNKAQIKNASITFADLVVSKGGIVPLASITAGTTAGSSVTLTPTKVSGATYGTNAKMVGIVYNATKKTGAAVATDYSGSTISVPITVASGDVLHCYAYVFDASTGTRKASNGVYANATIA